MFHEADLDDSEYPDEPDDDDSDETDDCPYCGQSVYDDAERCPSCGHYLSREDAPRRFPVWLIVGLLLSVLVVVRLIFTFCR